MKLAEESPLVAPPNRKTLNNKNKEIAKKYPTIFGLLGSNGEHEANLQTLHLRKRTKPTRERIAQLEAYLTLTKEVLMPTR